MVLARSNAQRLGVKIDVGQGDLLDAVRAGGLVPLAGEGAPWVAEFAPAELEARGLLPAEIAKVEKSLESVFDLRAAFAALTVGAIGGLIGAASADASIPGKWAAPPAPAMKHCAPPAACRSTNSASKCGVR